MSFATSRSMKAAQELCQMIPKSDGKANLRPFCEFPRKYFISVYNETCELLTDTKKVWQPECFERANGTWGNFEPTMTSDQYQSMI